MGFLSAYSGVVRIVIDTDRGYWIDLKKHLSQGDREASEKALAQNMVVTNGKTSVTPDYTAWRERLILASIAAWNLDDDSGNVWPITLDNLRLLPGDIYDQLWTEVDKMNSSRKGEEQQRFRDGDVGGHSDGDTRPAVA